MTPPLPKHFPLACDAHMHIFDAQQDTTPTGIADATVPMYRALQAQMGTQRTVVVQPRPYGLDNTLLLRSLASLGAHQTRGVVVVHPGISDAQLEAMHLAGVRGVRMTLYTPKKAVVSMDMLEPLAQRIAPLGWHVQLHLSAQQIVEQADVLRRLPCPVVFDHCARLPVPHPTQHPAFAVVADLLVREKAWLKLSGAHFCTVLDKTRADINYYDVEPIVHALIAAAPSRMVWGSDWPFITEGLNGELKPNALRLLALLCQWVGDEALLERILVDNPARLYGF